MHKPEVVVLDQETDHSTQKPNSGRGQKAVGLSQTQQNLKLVKVSSSGNTVQSSADNTKTASLAANNVRKMQPATRQQKPQISSKTQVIDMRQHMPDFSSDVDYFSQESQIKRL